MTRKLFLIRHAEASEKHSSQKDFDRNLTAEGMSQANRQGQRLNETDVMPDLILSSPSLRTQQTAEMIAERLKYEHHRIQYNEELYEASVRTLLREINEIDDQYENVFIIAHNPGISYLGEYLTRADIGTVVPAGILEMRFDVESWAEISEGTGFLENYLLPS